MFGISVFLVVRPVSGRALVGRASAVRLGLAGWAPVGTIAVAAGWLMLGVVWLTLGLDPKHPLLAFGVVTLGAVAFSSFAHLLRTALGTVGSSLLLVTLILQLAAAGGTYPAPILPRFFAAIHPFLPMSYLIDAFRVVVSGGLASHLARDVAILAAMAVVALEPDGADRRPAQAAERQGPAPAAGRALTPTRCRHSMATGGPPSRSAGPGRGHRVSTSRQPGRRDRVTVKRGFCVTTEVEPTRARSIGR